MIITLNHENKTYNLSNVVTSLELTSTWQNGADKLSFVYFDEGAVGIKNGDYVTFSYDGTSTMFAGIVFSNTKNKDNKCEVTCYDQRRYLKAKDTILRNNVSLTSFIKTCAGNLKLACGDMSDSVVKLKKYLFDNETYLDMIYKSINDNLMLNGYYYCLRDEGGYLTLKELNELRLPLVIGDGSLAYDYQLNNSIDTDTYNKIKLAKDNKTTGKRDIYIVEDSTNYGSWGVLQYFEKINEDYNEAQLKERAELLLKVKNRETQSLRINALGNETIRGGNSIQVRINSLDINTWAIVDKVTHKFDKQYTMMLELRFEEALK